jgi:integrase
MPKKVENTRISGEGRPMPKRQRESGSCIKLVEELEKSFRNDILQQADELIMRAPFRALIGRDRTVALETRRAYSKRAQTFFITLEKLGVRLNKVSELTVGHLTRVFQAWEAEGAGSSTLTNKFTIMRRVLDVMGKDVRPIRSVKKVLKDPERAKRRYVAVKPNTLASRGLSVEYFLDLLEPLCPITALQLKLIAAFGLRMEEVLFADPAAWDKGDFILVADGTKGGRTREVPIRGRAQQALLDEARRVARERGGTLHANPGAPLHVAKNRFYYLMRKIGLTRKANGVTPYSLRHQFLCDVYEDASGTPAPVLGGKPSPEAHRAGQKAAARAGGHGRLKASAPYTSGPQTMDRARDYRLKGLTKFFEESSVVESLRDAGVTALWVVGPAARGDHFDGQLVLAWEGKGTVDVEAARIACVRAVGVECIMVPAHHMQSGELPKFEVCLGLAVNPSVRPPQASSGAPL